MNQMEIITWLWAVFAIVLIPFQIKIAAPYGRHASGFKTAFQIPNRLGWMLMEIVSPASLWLSWYYCGGTSSPALIFMSLWTVHYINRSFIYPLRIHTSGKKIPLAIVLGAVFFNSVNGILNGYAFADGFVLVSAVFVIPGAVLFAAGFLINQKADSYLISLRSKKQGYQIPRHPLFKKISCPNMAGEILEWAGFALMCSTAASFTFFIWTASNLIPRALHHHRWYKMKFPNYPANRRALFPGIL